MTTIFSPSVEIRSINRRDVLAIQDMHARLSQATIQARFLGFKLPTFEDIYHICWLDDSKGSAFVAVAPDERIVGLAYYIYSPEQQTIAEPGLVVENSFQSQAIGHALTERLARHAVQHGLTMFRAHFRSDNNRVRSLI